jgi:hypothetical protein
LQGNKLIGYSRIVPATNATPLSPSETPTPTHLDEVPGWFSWIDQQLFTWFLERQERIEPPGDLLELGAYLGKSAILIGDHVRDNESFTVCDLFDSDAPDNANQAEMRRSYKTLTRTGFERNYLAFHDELPEIVQAPTYQIVDHVPERSCRFIHVDASHLYEHVHGDIEASRDLLRDGGVLVCDDYRAHHTPGVAAALWPRIVHGDFQPICASPAKVYGIWGDAGPIQQELIDWLAGREECWHQVQEVAGRSLVLVNAQRPKGGNAEVKKLKKQLDREQQARRAKEKELAAVRRSVSFRLGRLFTAPARPLARLTRRAS